MIGLMVHAMVKSSIWLQVWRQGLARAGCKIYVLDISEMAGLLGYPTCDPARFVTDPEFGTIMPNASMVLPKFNYTPPMQQYESMYPFYALPHYESLNAGKIVLPVLVAGRKPVCPFIHFSMFACPRHARVQVSPHAWTQDATHPQHCNLMSACMALCMSPCLVVFTCLLLNPLDPFSQVIG